MKQAAVGRVERVSSVPIPLADNWRRTGLALRPSGTGGPKGADLLATLGHRDAVEVVCNLRGGRVGYVASVDADAKAEFADLDGLVG